MNLCKRIGVGLGAIALVLSGLVPTAASAAEPVTAADLPQLLTVAEPVTSPAYERARFEHWIDADSNGCNTRYEVLLRDTLTAATKSAPCVLSGGSWQSAYDGVIAESPAEIEIDHVVALSEAWKSGAWS